MKQLVRTKSDTNLFFDKTNINLINENIKKLNDSKQVPKEASRSSRGISILNRNIKKKYSSGLEIMKQKSLEEKDKNALNESRSSSIHYFSENQQDSFSVLNTDEVTEEGFKNFMKSICNFRYDLKKQYLNRDVYYKKIFLNIQLEILLAKLKTLKENNLKIYLEEIKKNTDDSFYESPLSISTYDANTEINQVTSLNEKFEKIESVLQIFIKSSAEELFREVKTMMINEYYKTSLEIENFLQLNNKTSELIQFTAISDTSLYLISKFSFLLDFYSISSHSVVDKLQRFYVNYLEKLHKFDTTVNSTVSKCLDLIYKFIKLKKEFIKEFCQNGIPSSTSNAEIENTELFLNSKFTYNKFNSFGLYFFNNLFGIVDSVTSNEQEYKKRDKIFDSPFSDVFSPKKKKAKNTLEFNWKSYAPIQVKDTKQSKTNDKLCKVFKLYFTSKMAVWKYISVQGEKSEVCRMCEKIFTLDEYMLHVFYCKYQKYYSKKISELNSHLTKICEELRLYKEKLTKDLIDGNKATDIFFSPLSELNQRFRMHMIEKTPKLICKNSLGTKKKEAEVELLNTLMFNLKRERDQSDYEYEKHSHRLIQLISMINFTIIIFNQNLNSSTFSYEINTIFSRLLIILMNKLKMIENVMTFNDNKDKVINKTNELKQRKLTTSGGDSPFISSVGMQSRVTIPKSETPDKINCLRQLSGNVSKNNSAKDLSKLVDEKRDKFKRHSNSSTNSKKLPAATNNLNSILFKQEPKSTLSEFPSLGKKDFPKVDVTASRIKEVRNQLKLGSDLKQILTNNTFSITKDNNNNEFESSLVNSPKGLTKCYNNNLENISDNEEKSEDNTNSVSTKFDSNKNLRELAENLKQNICKKSFFHKNVNKSSKFSVNNTIILSPGKNVITTNYVFFNEKTVPQGTSEALNNPPENNNDEDFFNFNESENININNYLNENLVAINNDDPGSKLEIDSQFDEIIDLMDELDHSKDDAKEKKLNMTEIKDEMESDSSNSKTSIENYSKPKEPLKISDFQFVKPVTKGGYGRVDIYKKISTGDIFAIKTVNINAMKKKNVGIFLKKEALILHEVDNDYIVKCFYIFSDTKNYYFVMEFMPGGDLLSLINHLILKPETIRLIVAEVILALEYLHSIDIIHRDIKPENIVISKEGHIKLTDFGISELGLSENKFALTYFDADSDFINEEISSLRSKKILGTENYMAPEVIKNEEITNAADYWALGVLIYELHTNKLPFMAERKTEIFEKILNNKIDWKTFDDLIYNTPKGLFSEKYLQNARHLISKFLIIDKNERWDSKNVNNIKNHPYFEKFDWKTFRTNKINSQMHVHLQKQLQNLKEKTNTPQLSKKESSEVDRDKNASESDTINEPEQIFSTERVDNLFKKCMELIKNKVQINPDNNNITNIIYDVD